MHRAGFGICVAYGCESMPVNVLEKAETSKVSLPRKYAAGCHISQPVCRKSRGALQFKRWGVMDSTAMSVEAREIKVQYIEAYQIILDH